MNNGVLWQTLMTIFYRSHSPYQPWMIKLSHDETGKRHLVRIRLFQRVTTSMSDSIVSLVLASRPICRMDIDLDIASIRNDS